jgi:hypothetical protein
MTKKRSAFSFLEVMVALSLISLIFMTGAIYSQSLIKLWESAEELPDFQDHGRSVERFINHLLMEDRNESLKWGSVEGISKRMIQTNITNPDPIFVLDHQSPVQELNVYFHYREEDGFSLIWKNVAKGSRQKQWVRTPISRLVNQIEYVFIDPLTKEEEIQLDTAEANNQFEKDPDLMRIHLSFKGHQKQIEIPLKRDKKEGLVRTLVY